MTPGPPRVSIAIPVYNGAKTIRASIDSALAQTYDGLELVIVDNASTDDTVEIVNSYDDPRIRLHQNPSNIGFHRNHSRSFELSRCEFIKPLHADDRLMPHCVERMLELFDANEKVALVFAPRSIELEDESDEGLRSWREEYGRLHRNFTGLQRVNDGRFLLQQYLRAADSANWVGEPSSIMVRRSSIERIGLFSPHVEALNDLDMSMRMMALYDVGFVDEELTVFLRRRGSLVDSLSPNQWLDRLWLLEGISMDPAMRSRAPEVAPALAQERRNVARQLVRTARRRPAELPLRLRQMGRYLRFAARSAAGRAPRLHPPLEPVGS
ncbi:MAG: glycosyltransferase family 2 protein [Solirubrobacteraceae bacterium]